MKIKRGEPNHKFILGNCNEVLSSLPDASVQLVITSPPYYSLRCYGTPPQVWGDELIKGCNHEWSEPHPGKRSRWGDTATLSQKQSSNRGSKSNVAALERDSGRTCKKCFSWEGELGQEKNSVDYLHHLSLVTKQLHRVLKDDGILFLNIGDKHCDDPAEVSCGSLSYPKSLYLIPERLADRLKIQGFYIRNMIIWVKDNAMPRSVKDNFTPTYEFVIMASKSANYKFDQEAVMEPAKSGGTRLKRDVWNIPNQIYKKNGIHYASFPEKLVEPCILSGSDEGDVILDPFAGICTVATVAARYRRKSISIELNPDYLRIGRQRVREADILRKGISSVLVDKKEEKCENQKSESGKSMLLRRRREKFPSD